MPVKAENNEVFGKAITFEREKMIAGEYDLGKKFGIDFKNKESIPDRKFLENVTFTKNIYLGLNNIYQSFYRISTRQKEGATSLDEMIGPDFLNGKVFCLKGHMRSTGYPAGSGSIFR